MVFGTSLSAKDHEMFACSVTRFPAARFIGWLGSRSQAKQIIEESGLVEDVQRRAARNHETPARVWSGLSKEATGRTKKVKIGQERSKRTSNRWPERRSLHATAGSLEVMALGLTWHQVTDLAC